MREARSRAQEFRRHKFAPADAEEFAEFLNWLRLEHWTLTSTAFQREPEVKPLVTARQLIEADRSPDRIGTFLLHRGNRIIASVVVDEKTGEGQRVAVFSAAETHPDYQRRGTFWRWLGIPLIRALCAGGFDRLEAVTWPLNRKGIPVYERFGFRRVPGEGLRMVNYLPLLVRHPALRKHLSGLDWVRDLRWQREQGGERSRQDAVCYEWRRRGSEESVVAILFHDTTVTHADRV